MYGQMKWENAYDLWKTGYQHFHELLSSPVSAETVFVEYKQDGYIYGIIGLKMWWHMKENI